MNEQNNNEKKYDPINSVTGLKKGIVIALGNQKGGVGKTTNTVHIATALAQMGRKCLIIDLDMNHGSTLHFGLREPEAFLGSFEFMIGGENDPREIVFYETTKDDETNDVIINLPENLSIITASRRLENIDKALAQSSKFATPKDALQKPLELIKQHNYFDYIFLDTAPNLTTPTLAAYMCSDYFVLSTLPDAFAINGLGEALKDLRDAQQRGNSKLKLLGVIVSSIDSRTSIANSLTKYVDEAFQNDIGTGKFNTTISRSTVIPQAQKEGKTLFEHSPTHKVTQEYRNLAKEMESRLLLLNSIPVSQNSEVANG